MPPATFSLYLEPEPAESLACMLAGGTDRARAIDRMMHEDRWRVVRFAPLDVHTDPLLRVVQVITSLQLGGAERIALTLHRSLQRQGVACRLVTLGQSVRQAFAASPGPSTSRRPRSTPSLERRRPGRWLATSTPT